MKGQTMDIDKVKLRRYEDDLNVGGLGVVILGAWDFLKIIMGAITTLKKGFSIEELAGEYKTAALVVIIAIITVVTLAAFLIFKIHMYIGLNASKAAKGEPYKKGYYKGAIILLVIFILGMSGYIYLFQDLENIDTTIASFIVDTTTIYILWIVVSSTRKIKQLRSSHTRE